MSFQTRDADLIRTDTADTLVSATELGAFPGFVAFRRPEDTDGDFIADVYDEDGKVVASYPVSLIVGAPLP